MTPIQAAPERGLTTAEVLRRREDGLGNEVDERAARSLAGIVRANVLTRFNAIIAALTAVVLIFGHPVDALFALVMVLNSSIGIVQEVRAKRTLDALRVLVVPEVTVYRDGTLSTVPPADLVVGDVIELTVGDQIPVDGTVLTSSGLEVDESALTGESDPVAKPGGAEVLSGSHVVAGRATVEAVQVGAESWVQRLTREAKQFVLTESELRVGIDRLLRVIGWILPGASALLLWSQLGSESGLDEAVISTVAGVVSLVPQGLVLLISMTMAVAVLRLAENHVVVQELPAVEGLARVDVLCVDKTGTLTTGRLTVDGIEPVQANNSNGDGDLRSALAALAELDAARSATLDAIRPEVEADRPGWGLIREVSFSSERKWSGADFGPAGTWVLGAPEILLDACPGPTAAVRERVDVLTGQARRVLLVARSRATFADETLPDDLVPVGLVSLKEEVRPDAAATMAYFAEQHVTIKVISGDNPRTVAAVAAELGIEGADRYVDLRTVAPADISPEAGVFGRVRPEQKRDLVAMLKEQGHTVAMTGDGVNDIPSLKAADIGIAMDTATPATKATAQLVLLDGRFDRLPAVVAEGRRVIANMERVSCLFITKTVYATLMIAVIAAVAVPFPFLPRHMSIVAALTIGIPGFALSFRRSDEPSRSGYLRRVLRFSVPAGCVAATLTLVAYGAARSSFGGAELGQARTIATITLTLTGLWILHRLARPIDRSTTLLFVVLLVGLAGMLVPSPLSTFYALPLPAWPVTAAVIAALVVMVGVIELVSVVSTGARNGSVSEVYAAPIDRDTGPMNRGLLHRRSHREGRRR